MDSTVTQKIVFEIKQIDELINNANPICSLCRIREPDFVERCGIALILHSFYNGIENIMSLIIKNKDLSLPNGIKWHKELFTQAFRKTDNRSMIFREEMMEPLNEYLQFRHFIRHTYGFQIKWEKIKNMFFDINMIWEKLKEDINNFIKNN